MKYWVFFNSKILINVFTCEIMTLISSHVTYDHDYFINFRIVNRALHDCLEVQILSSWLDISYWFTLLTCDRCI